MAQQLSPLHEAVEADDLSRVQALVGAGADIEERAGKDRESATPLYRAAKKGYVVVARYLVERGADKEAVCRARHTKPIQSRGAGPALGAHNRGVLPNQ